MIKKLQDGVKMAQKLGLLVNAGHGLTYQNVGLLVESLVVEELHIGHSIVSRAVFVGIRNAVSEMRDLIFKHSLARKFTVQ